MPTFQERAARLRGGGGASEGIEYFIETKKVLILNCWAHSSRSTSPHSCPGLPTERGSRVVLLIDSDISFDYRGRARSRDRWRLRLDV